MPFCIFRYIDDARCLTGDNTPAAAKQLSSRRNNIVLSGKESSIPGNDLTKFGNITLVADNQVVVGEEILLD